MPSPASILTEPSVASVAGQSGAQAPGAAPVPYTKWYRVWERTSPKDFMQEAMIMPFIVFIIIFHLWGTRKNRRKVKAWAQAHAPVLRDEFAAVGFKGVSTADKYGIDSS